MVSNPARDKVRGSRSGAQGGKVLAWRENRKPSEQVAWEFIATSLLQAAIGSITASGAAIMLGVTSDGGAYSICVLDGDRKIKEYPHTKVECEEILEELRAFYA